MKEEKVLGRSYTTPKWVDSRTNTKMLSTILRSSPQVLQ